MKILYKEETKKGFYKIFLKNKIHLQYLGDFVMDVDGLYYYWPSDLIASSRGFCWSGWMLLLLGEELKKLNKNTEEHEVYFKEREFIENLGM